MNKWHPNHRLVKTHRSYTVEEVAALFRIHKNTVRTWIRAGLPTIDRRRPMLILGGELISFLKRRRTRNKQVCQPWELYCVRCRAPRSPAGNMAEYVPFTHAIGNLVAICPECDAIINRRVSLARITMITAKIEISFPQALRHIGESSNPTVISDLPRSTRP